MKKHVRALYAIAVVVIVAAGVAMMMQNNALESAVTTAHAATGPTP